MCRTCNHTNNIYNICSSSHLHSATVTVTWHDNNKQFRGQTKKSRPENSEFSLKLPPGGDRGSVFKKLTAAAGNSQGSSCRANRTPIPGLPGHARVLALPPGPVGSAVCAAALLRAPPRAAAARQCATTCVLRSPAQDSLYITVNKQDNQPSLCHEQ